MKISKKVLIPVFATAMGLSVIGGVGGAVAWYQYNSKVTANFIGASVEDKGVLQIGTDAAHLSRAVDKTENPHLELKPVTFGATADGAVGKQGWMYPEAGAGIGYYEKAANKPGWEKAVNGTDYLQFDLYFSAYENDSETTGGKKYVEKNVYISNSFLRCLDHTNHTEDANHKAVEALRIQLDVEGGASWIIGKVDSASTTNLYGELGLGTSDPSDHDIYYNDPFITLPEGAVVGEEVEYGVHGETQSVTPVSAYAAGGTALFKTSANSTPVKVTVTIWLEGWAMIDSDAVWDANKTAGCDVQAALQFTTAD